MSSCYRRLTTGVGERDTMLHHKPIRATLKPDIVRIINSSKQRPGIILRSERATDNNLRSWTVRSLEEERESRREVAASPCRYAIGDSEERGIDRTAAAGGIGGELVWWNWHVDKKKVEVAVAVVATVVLGVANRVLQKMALVPLKHYPFFLAQLSTFGYVIVYFSILYLRHQAGVITDEMLSTPKAPFVAIGILEALAAATSMAAGAILSGASIPILSQTFLVWQILLSIIFLGKRYKVNQLLGCFLVAFGVIITVASGSGAGSLKDAGIFWSLLMIVSFLFQAADTVLKEIIFLDAAHQLKGGSMDLFVVNSYGSAFQALFIFLLLPFLSKLWGIPFNLLPNYLRDGAACFLNLGALSNGCDGAPLLPFLFVLANMGFNIALLHLLKISSAVVSCLASTVSVPIAVYTFTLPLPYLGVPSSLPPGFVTGTVILVWGMLIYAWTPSATSTSSAPRTSSN